MGKTVHKLCTTIPNTALTAVSDAVLTWCYEYYCADNGRPSVPIRKMVGMMLLKNIYNLSDEGVVACWLENPYMQYFTGEKVFQKRPPMNPIDMTKVRKRIGTQGAEKIFKISLMVNAEEITAKEMKMVSDIARKMDDHQLSFYGKDLALFVRVINQERSDKDKVYSLHEPEVQCISKGKEHKKYEFGNKSAIAKTRSGLIVSALAFIGNPYDGHTISAHLEQTTG